MVLARLRMALVVTVPGVLLFGGGGGWAIAEEWGLDNRSVQIGLAAGLAVNVVLGVIGFVRGFPPEEELDREADPRVVTAWVTVILGGLGALVLFGSKPLVISFCIALMAGASVLCSVLAFAPRRPSQRAGVEVESSFAVRREPPGRAAPDPGAGRKQAPGADAEPPEDRRGP